MKITSVEASIFPFTTHYQPGIEREGLAIQLKSGCWEGEGESYYLEGYTPLTPRELLQQLPLLRKTLIGREISSELLSLSGLFAAWLGGLPSQLRFAVEMASLCLLAQPSASPVSQFLGGDPHREIAMTALFDAADPDLLEKIAWKVQRGIRCIKLKIARQEVKKDLTAIRSLCDAFGSTIKIRLDANRKWSISQAQEAFQGLSDLPIEYVEEPVKDWRISLQLASEAKIPLALDETISQQIDSTWQEATPLRAVIIKPFLLGSFEKAAQIARQAKSRKIEAVIGTSYESQQGRVFLNEFAKVYQSTKLAGSFEI